MIINKKTKIMNRYNMRMLKARRDHGLSHELLYERVIERPVEKLGERVVATVLGHRADYGFASDFGTTNTCPGKMTLGL